MRPANELLGISVICLALVAGGYLVLTQETEFLGMKMCERPLSLGAMAAFYALVVGISDPVRKLSDVLGYLQQAAAAADRVMPLLERRPAIVDPAAPVPLAAPHRELSFDRVSFHYRPGEPVLREFDLRIRFGEKLAVVGPNGCGKSTLVNLLCRFYDPVEGALRIDGVDLRDVRVRELRRKIGIVTQQTVLFDDTVLNNIRYGAPHATDEEAIAASKKAHAHRFIVEKLEGGYRTVVGERGGRLSGGQRQRMALAQRHPAPPGNPDPRRSDQPDRFGERTAHPSGVAGVFAGPHGNLHHPPAIHARAGRPHLGHGRRLHCRHRLAPRTALALRRLPPPARPEPPRLGVKRERRSK